MKVLIGIWHPAHVHFFRNTILNLQENGHEIQIVTRNKEMTLELLDAYNFEYISMGEHHKSTLSKGFNLLSTDYALYKIAKKFQPDVLTGIMDMYSAHVGRLIGKPSIIFSDTEYAKVYNLITFPFATTICTPTCYQNDLGKKQVRYDGYHELAYVHDNYFSPNPDVLDELGLNINDKFIILRFVSWGAHHDINDRGFTNVEDVVSFLEKYGQVLITSEKKIPPNLEKYKIAIGPENIHHLLYFATLYIGESATMASESALLGTPSIFVSTSRRGYTDELESKYDLIYNFSDPKKGQESALKKAFDLLENQNLKKEWEVKRKKMLREKIDVTEFMSDFIENYPGSFYKYLQSRQNKVLQ